MLINTQFDERTVVHGNPLNWVATRMEGVERHMLDRIGAESGHATSIVRYAPGSSFSPHIHQGGEEFLVLEGIFQDEHGDYPTGTYVRNPPTSRHTPRSDEGCTIFVKLWQFDMADRNQFSIDPDSQKLKTDKQNSHIETFQLHKDEQEDVRMEFWHPGSQIYIDAPYGMEILVLEGGFEETGEIFEKNAWLRLPRDYRSIATVGKDGANIWLKSSHLRNYPQV